MKIDRTVCRHAVVNKAPGHVKSRTFLGRLRHWMRLTAPEERYLAAANDHADLERRMRAIERASHGPALVTFNR